MPRCKKVIPSLFSLLFTALVFVALPASRATAAAPAPPSFADLAEKLGPTVVNVYTKKVLKRSRKNFHGQVPEDFPDFFKKFFDMPNQGPSERKVMSLGSGVIISADGYIVTNNHVIKDAEEINVRLTDFEEFEAKIIGKDPKTDVALIKIKPKKDLPFATFGDSAKLRVGEWVIAIGNPFGFENTVTAGIVSAKGRNIGNSTYENFIQTDASINMGNSGGPLFNMNGELVGINSAIFSRDGGNIGLGFAIPVNMVHNVVDQIKKHGKVIRGWLGVMVQHVNADLAKEFGLDRPRGALVGEVMKDSPAAKGGIKQGDIIVKFMDKDIRQMTELPAMVAQTPVGTNARVVVIRKGKEKTLTIKIGRLKEDMASSGDSEEIETSEDLGLTVQELTPELARGMKLDDAEGLVVTDVEPGSAAADARITPGEIILQVNQNDIRSIEDYRKAMDRIKKGDNVLLLVRKGDHSRFVVIKNR